MFWDNDKDSEDMQRFKNMLFLKMPVKNETRDEVMPGMAIVLLVVVVIGLIAVFVG